MDFISQALLDFENLNESENIKEELCRINSKQTLDTITLLLKDIYYLKLQNRRAYPLNILIHILNKNFGFNGYNIEIISIEMNSSSEKYNTTVSIIIKQDGTYVTATSKSESSVKKSITMAIKKCILYKFEELYDKYTSNQ